MKCEARYLDYSMSVIVGRALPDVRDGLKPVHRRVLYAMYDLSNTYNKAYKKSARVVGDVIGKYHPHGDTAVYDTIVRMAQDFSLRYPLIDGQGNFGSVDGDSPAAMRYTEIRMDRISDEMLADLDKETVDFGPNYDDSLQEPKVLPSRVPNLLINGGSGIAVGMATNIPPHNLSEVVDATIALIDDPSLDTNGLLEYRERARFPDRGNRVRWSSFERGLSHGPWLSHDPGQGGNRELQRGSGEDHHHGDPLPGQQGQDGREDRRSREREKNRRNLGSS